MKYIFHPEALTEYARAVEFYAEQNKELAQDFIDAVESAIFKVIEFLSAGLSLTIPFVVA